MQERRAPHQHVQVLHCHGDSLKFARRHGHIYNYINIYDGELYSKISLLGHIIISATVGNPAT